MKKTSFGFIVLTFFGFWAFAKQPTAQTSFYSFQTKDLDGKTVKLTVYKGKVSLVVNTASGCGFTPQYDDLETIYKKYNSRGFVVLGFPSNDFGGQEPGSNQEIKKFCDLKTGKYKVSFPIFSKSNVKSEPQNPIYEFLTQKSPLEFRGEVGWNFTKFLVDPSGQVVGRFSSSVKPTDEQVTSAIEKLLK